MNNQGNSIIKRQGRWDESLNETDYRKLIYKELEAIHKKMNELPAKYDQGSKSVVITQPMSSAAVSVYTSDTVYLYKYHFDMTTAIKGSLSLCKVPKGYAIEMILIQVYDTAFPPGMTIRITDGTNDLVRAKDVFLEVDPPVDFPFLMFEEYSEEKQLTARFPDELPAESTGKGRIIIRLTKIKLIK